MNWKTQTGLVLLTALALFLSLKVYRLYEENKALKKFVIQEYQVIQDYENESCDTPIHKAPSA